jgi:hypothetical protein
MNSFLLAIPAYGASYLFGSFCDAPGGAELALASFRQEHPDTRVRLLIAPPSWSDYLWTTVSNLVSHRMSRTYVRHLTRTFGRTHQITGDTDAGIASVEALVRAVVGSELIESELLAVPAVPAAVPAVPAAVPKAPSSDPVKPRASLPFFFAHADDTPRLHSIGTSPDPAVFARRLQALHPEQNVTLYSGHSPRAGELVVVLMALLNEPDAAADPGLLDDFIAPVIRSVVGRGEGGLNVQVFPGRA